MSNPYAYIIFTLLLIKQIFENRSLRAASESQTQFWPRIILVIIMASKKYLMLLITTLLILLNIKYFIEYFIKHFNTWNFGSGIWPYFVFSQY